jgi:hypothetical protein
VKSALGRAAINLIFQDLVLPSLPKDIVDFAQASLATFWRMAEKLDGKRRVAFPVFSWSIGFDRARLTGVKVSCLNVENKFGQAKRTWTRKVSPLASVLGKGKAWCGLRYFCPPYAVLCQRQFAAQRSGSGAGFGNCGAGWFVELLGNGEWFGWWTAVSISKSCGRETPPAGWGFGEMREVG